MRVVLLLLIDDVSPMRIELLSPLNPSTLYPMQILLVPPPKLLPD